MRIFQQQKGWAKHETWCFIIGISPARDVFCEVGTLQLYLMTIPAQWWVIVLFICFLHRKNTNMFWWVLVCFGEWGIVILLFLMCWWLVISYWFPQAQRRNMDLFHRFKGFGWVCVAITFMFTCAHVWCLAMRSSLALAHILPSEIFSCTFTLAWWCTHRRSYFALAHMLDAMLRDHTNPVEWQRSKHCNIIGWPIKVSLGRPGSQWQTHAYTQFYQGYWLLIGDCSTYEDSRYGMYGQVFVFGCNPHACEQSLAASTRWLGDSRSRIIPNCPSYRIVWVLVWLDNETKLSPQWRWPPIDVTSCQISGTTSSAVFIQASSPWTIRKAIPARWNIWKPNMKWNSGRSTLTSLATTLPCPILRWSICAVESSPRGGSPNTR